MLDKKCSSWYGEFNASIFGARTSSDGAIITNLNFFLSVQSSTKKTNHFSVCMYESKRKDCNNIVNNTSYLTTCHSCSSGSQLKEGSQIV